MDHVRNPAQLAASSLGRGADGHPLSPLAAALPLLVVALAVLGIGFAAEITWLWVVAAACLLGLVALAQGAYAAVGLERRRRVADEWLLWGAAARPASALLSWRAGELASARLRGTLVHSLRRIEREVRCETRLGPVPLNRRAIRAQLGLLRALRERLADRAVPVTVRGMLLADRLLTEPASPLYSSVPDHVLADALSEALAELELSPPPQAACARR
jgi:hypothetical protein